MLSVTHSSGQLGRRGGPACIDSGFGSWPAPLHLWVPGPLPKLSLHRFLFCKMGIIRITTDLLVLNEFHKWQALQQCLARSKLPLHGGFCYSFICIFNSERPVSAASCFLRALDSSGWGWSRPASHGSTRCPLRVTKDPAAALHVPVLEFVNKLAVTSILGEVT